jgi:hypothetical protein
VVGGVGQDFGIGRRIGQHFAQQDDRMPEVPEHMPEVVGHVVIEEGCLRRHVSTLDRPPAFSNPHVNHFMPER